MISQSRRSWGVINITNHATNNKFKNNLSVSAFDLFLIISFILSIMGMIVFKSLDIPTLNYSQEVESTQYLYLISTIAQSLAAILALSITITIIVLQMQSQYSHLYLRNYIDIYSGLYIVLFISTISLSFLLLTNTYSTFFIVSRTTLTKITLLLSLGCLLYLVPYLFSFREKLKLDSLIRNLREKANKSLQKNPTEEPESVKIIEHITIKASQLKDYEAFELGVGALATISVIAAYFADNIQTVETIPRTQEKILGRIKYLFETTIDDIHSPFAISRTLGNSYMKAAKLSLKPNFSDGCNMISQLCFMAINKKNERLAIYLCSQLTQIGTTSVDYNNVEQIRSVSQHLLMIGIQASNSRIVGLLKESITSQIEIGTWLMYKSDREELSILIASNLKGLETALYELIGHQIDIFKMNPLTVLTYSTLDSKIGDSYKEFENFYKKHNIAELSGD